MSNRAVLQRFSVVRPGTSSYPQKWHYSLLWWDEQAGDDEQFFTHQEARQGRYFDGNRQPFLVRVADADLNLADDGRLAIVATGEAKTFFATSDLIDEANNALGGQVRLEMTDRYLWNSHAEDRLFEVEPVVDAQDQRGTAMKTPQRCNEMAGFVSGHPTLRDPDSQQALDLLAQAVESASGEAGWRSELQRLYKLTFKVMDDPYAYARFGEQLVNRALSVDIRDRVESELTRLGANRGLDPRVGRAIAIFSAGTAELAEAARGQGIEPFPYHFATVVARSSTDYVTLENYARRDPVVVDTLSQGDPLYFFRMYSIRTPDQTWHAVQHGSGGLIGATVSLEYR